MKKRWVILFIIFFVTKNTSAQLLYDNNWVLGNWKNIIIDFKNDTFHVIPIDSSIFYHLTSATISDPNLGGLLFYTNGKAAYNRYHQIMKNGDTLSPQIYFYGQPFEGYPIIQGDIILPSNNNNIYRLIHADIESFSWGDAIYRLRSSIIDFTESDSGKVIDKNKIFFTDTMTTCGMAANMDAIGLNWWLTKTEFRTNHYWSWKITNDSIQNPISSNFGVPYKLADGVGGFCFSPNGNWFAGMTYDSVSLNQYVLNIAKFDRCTGDFFEGFSVYLPFRSDYRGSCVFSPNSRFVYAITTNYIYQFDLEAEDIQASIDTIGEMINDSGDLYVQELRFGQLTKTGKIYIGEYDCSHSYIHVIENPDKKGDDCNFHQKGIIIPTNCDWGIPYFPNYNLKALGNYRAEAGENKTICKGNWVQLGAVAIEGVKYEWIPTSTLSNANSPNPIASPKETTTYYCTFTDTTTFSSCNVSIDTVVVEITDDKDCEQTPPVQTLLTQNENFNIYNLPAGLHLTLYNALGQLIFFRVNYQNDFSIRNLPLGMYFYVLEINGLQNQGKFVVMR